MGIITGNIYAGIGGGGGGTLTGAQNGASVVGTFVELGGNPLLHATTIDGAGFDLTIVDANLAGDNASYTFSPFGFQILANNAAGTYTGQFVSGGNQAFLGMTNAISFGNTGINIQPLSYPGIKIQDGDMLFGAFYESDYSALGFVNPRWLADIGTILANFTQQKSRAIVNAVNSSRNLVNFATATGNDMYRVTVTTEILTGTGVLATSVSYTDLSGTPQGPILVDTLTGVGVSNNIKVLNILCQASTHISIDTVLTGTASGSIGFSIELLA